MADSGSWVVIGAAIATVGSIAATSLNVLLTTAAQRKGAFPKYDKIVCDLIEAMLRSGPPWRPLEEFQNVTGCDEQMTKEYLIIVGARGQEGNGTLWGRNPISDVAHSN